METNAENHNQSIHRMMEPDCNGCKTLLHLGLEKLWGLKDQGVYCEAVSLVSEAIPTKSHCHDRPNRSWTSLKLRDVPNTSPHLYPENYIAEESWGQERWSFPREGHTSLLSSNKQPWKHTSNVWIGQVMVRCQGGVHVHWHLIACVGVRGQTTCGQIPGIKLSCQAWSQEPLPAELYHKIGKWCRMHASKAVFSTCGARPLVEQPFHRGRLRPQENTNIYIMIHSSSKVTVMKQ